MIMKFDENFPKKIQNFFAAFLGNCNFPKIYSGISELTLMIFQNQKISKNR